MRAFAFIILLAGLAAPLSAQAGADQKPAKIKRQPNLISLEEIEQVRNEATNAYDIVKRLRPQFLRGRGANSFGNAAGGSSMATPKLVVDGSPVGDISMLNQIPASNVREIRYLSSSDATTQFGTGYDGGAVVVMTR
jgi:hypothetical protein